MKQAFCLGELLIFSICCDNISLSSGIHFEKKSGGAPANAMASIQN